MGICCGRKESKFAVPLRVEQGLKILEQLKKI